MHELKAKKPIESPEGSDPVSRLMQRLRDEGFTTEQHEEDWEMGEIIYRRSEKISLARGETIFIFTRVRELNEKILRQTSESVGNTYRAKNVLQKALTVLQSTTVFHCLVSESDQPQSGLLDQFVIRKGGATFIPVIIVAGINQVVYPNLEEKIGSVRPRVEYLQYLLGERLESVNMHRQTVQAFWVAVGVVIVLLAAVGLSLIPWQS